MRTLALLVVIATIGLIGCDWMHRSNSDSSTQQSSSAPQPQDLQGTDRAQH